MGIGIAFLLGPGWFALEVLGEAKPTIFQNLVYWACFLLICAVHELSKRRAASSKEAGELRSALNAAQQEIRGLQADVRKLRDTPSPTGPLKSSYRPPSGSQPGPWERV